jgi:hypothetical protein
MPAFMDCHSLSDVSLIVLQQLQGEVDAGFVDPNGVRVFGHWAEEGVIYCVIDAPDESAVVKHHAARLLRCNDLHRLDGLSGSPTLTADDEARVREEIMRYWHASPA